MKKTAHQLSRLRWNTAVAVSQGSLAPVHPCASQRLDPALDSPTAVVVFYRASNRGWSKETSQFGKLHLATNEIALVLICTRVDNRITGRDVPALVLTCSDSDVTIPPLNTCIFSTFHANYNYAILTLLQHMII